MHKRLTDVPAVVGLAGVYILAARLGLSFDAVAGFATLVWPPTGIALAAILLLGYRVWPGIFIGAVVANVLTGAPLAVALGIGCGNTAEALAGAYLLRRVPGFSVTLESVRGAVGLMVLAALFSTLISATVGVASLYLGHIVSATQIRETWRAWWAGDIVGAVLVAPIILVWSRSPRARFRPPRTETLAFPAALVVVSVWAFLSDVPNIPKLATPFHQTDLLLAVMLWAALRFSQRGAVTANFYLSATAIAATVAGHGPFVLSNLHDSLLSLQTFMTIAAATSLLLGATVAEWRCALDREREANEVAARANRAKSEFLAVMSHELRTPLNAIGGYSDLLKTGVYGALNAKQMEAVARIDRNEHELLGVINELLAFVRLERGEIAVHSESINVAEAFDAAEPVIEPEMRRKHVVLRRVLAPPVLAVQADRQGLQQILTTLLSNASKFTEEGGVITLGADRSDGRVRIWVRDTGIGIPEDQIQRVFEPFYQAERGTTRRFSGIGLGLTIARDLARQMAGEMTIASQVGAGTTASVVLPAGRTGAQG